MIFSSSRRDVAVAFLVVQLLSFAIFTTAESDTTDYYGLLQVPPSFRHSPHFHDPFYRTQPGSVLLSNGKSDIIRATVGPDGMFVVRNVPYGSYLLQADFYDFVFPTMLVEVQYKKGEKDSRTPVIHTSRNDYPVTLVKGRGTSAESPAVIPTAGVVSYYIPREKFNPMGLLKNPMVIMLLIGGAMTLMTKFIPEEELKKSRAQSKQMNKMLLNPQEALENAMNKKKQ